MPVIEVLNWDEFQKEPRRVVKHPSHFMLPSDLLERELWLELDANELKLLISIWATKAKFHNTHASFELSPKRAKHISGMDTFNLDRSLKKLEDLGLIVVIQAQKTSDLMPAGLRSLRDGEVGKSNGGTFGSDGGAPA